MEKFLGADMHWRGKKSITNRTIFNKYKIRQTSDRETDRENIQSIKINDIFLE